MTDANTPTEGKSNFFRWFTAAVIILMIVLMVFSSNTVSHQSHMAHGVLMGTSNSGDVFSQDARAATNLLDQLSIVHVAVPTAPNMPPQLEPLLDVVWGQAVVKDLKAHPQALYLALREARRVSPGVNPYALGSIDPAQQQPEQNGIFNSGTIGVDDLRPLPTSPLGRYRAQIGGNFGVEIRVIQRAKDNRITQLSPTALPPLEQQGVYAALYDFLTLQSAASLPLNAVKPTSPMVDRMLAEQFQSFSLELATVDAAALVSKVPEPTDAQLVEHLKNYAEFPAGRLSADNPFGFGYRVPDRVKLEIISIKRSDVRKVVEAEKTPYDWDVAARMAFSKDPALVPTSQPTTQATTLPAASTYESVKDLAIAATIDRAADARVVDIEKAIRAPMTLDYQQWANATTTRPGVTTAPSTVAPKSSFDVAYNAPDYLYKLADAVNKKFNVRPTVELYTDRFRDEVGLRGLVGFNEATRPLPPGLASRTATGAGSMTGPDYAINFAKDLLDAQRLEMFGGLVLERYRPSERLELTRDGGRERELYYFRITDAQKNHPGTEIEPIREKLKSDWRAAEAQKLAVAQATAAVDAARSAANFESAVGQVIPGATIIRTKAGPFRSAPADDNTLGLSLPQFVQLGMQVVDKLLGESSGIAVLNVPLAAKAYVAKRLGVEGGWQTSENLRTLRQDVRAQLASKMAEPQSDTNPYGVTGKDIAATWFDSKSVLERFAYKPASEETSAE